MRRPRIWFKNDNISMQFRCSKIDEKVIGNVPKWLQNCYKMGTNIQKQTLKNRSETKKTLILGSICWRPPVPILLAKCSPTKRTSSRKQNKNETKRKGNPQDSFLIPTRPARGGPPGPERTFYKSLALGPSKNCPGARFWKNNEKRLENQWFSMVQNYWKIF